MADVGNTLPLDPNGNPIQVARSIQTQDGTGTPQDSPKTSVTTVLTLVPPANAVVCWIQSSVAGRVGDNATLDGTADEGYFPLAADTPKAIPCAGGGNVYFLPDSSASVYFYFEMME